MGRTANPVKLDPPSFPSLHLIVIAWRWSSDAVGGGHTPGQTAGVRDENVGIEKPPCGKETNNWATYKMRVKVNVRATYLEVLVQGINAAYSNNS